MLIQNSTGIYIRVSTEDQAKEGFSIPAQKEKLTKYAELNDWVIYDFYIDDGISGKNLKNRPEVNRLIKDVKDGVINNVLVYKLDRLTRNTIDLANLVELFKEHNCEFNSQTEKIDTSNAVGNMFVKMLGIFAEFERENLAERVTLGYEEKTRQGNYTNTNGVYGYDYLVGQNKLVINELEKEYVNKIYDWYLEGDSMRSICIKLHGLAIPTKRGGKWSQSTIKSILTNPTYIGKIRYGVNKKEKSFTTSGTNIKPIIEEEKYNSVQNLLKTRSQFKSKKHSSDDSYFSRVLRCDKCGGRYHARGQVQGGKKYITYACNGNYNGTCSMPGFSHKKIEQAFLDYLSNIDNFEYNNEIISKKNDIKSMVEHIKDELVKLTNKKKEVSMLFTDNIINIDEYRNMQDSLLKKEIQLTSELNSYDLEEKDELSKEEIEMIVTNISINFKNLTNSERKIFLERFIKEIYVVKDGDNVKITKINF